MTRSASAVVRGVPWAALASDPPMTYGIPRPSRIDATRATTSMRWSGIRVQGRGSVRSGSTCLERRSGVGAEHELPVARVQLLGARDRVPQPETRHGEEPGCFDEVIHHRELFGRRLLAKDLDQQPASFGRCVTREEHAASLARARGAPRPYLSTARTNTIPETGFFPYTGSSSSGVLEMLAKPPTAKLTG